VIKRRVKRKERVEELETPDEFQERGRPVVDWVLAKWRFIAGAVGAALLGLAVFGLLGRAENNRNAFAAGELAEALLKLPDVGGFNPDLSDEAPEVAAVLVELDKVIAGHGGSPQANQARVEAGNVAYRSGDYETALSYYDAAVKAPGLAGRLASTGAGYSLEALERFDEAATRFEALKKSTADKSKEQAMVNLGRVYEAAGQSDKAAAVYAEFETEFPDSSRLADVQARAAGLQTATP
jgi:tetratricopeptide (TPR) repeat protein